jgi:hypothetical protein
MSSSEASSSSSFFSSAFSPAAAGASEEAAAGAAAAKASGLARYSLVYLSARARASDDVIVFSRTPSSEAMTSFVLRDEWRECLIRKRFSSFDPLLSQI